ncbi:MAG TPA: hypothetical protein VN956_27315 [Pyrinomonadaceae bacterium]|nr:hypothetical protein [Pyrinomonadaceae bacterium]
MNTAQRIVLSAAFLIILGMVLFPPWMFVYNYPGAGPIHAIHAERPAGHYLIFGQYTPQDPTQLAALFDIDTTAFHSNVVPERTRLQFFSLRIDGMRLGIQIAMAIILALLLTLILKSRSRKVIDPAA